MKIERPSTGDDARTYGPPYLADPGGKKNNNAFFLSTNRNKKSVTVNLADPEGQEIIRELANGADVFMENYKVGDLKRYGLNYLSIRRIHPGIVYCSVTGFGQTGPHAHRAGYDAICARRSGLSSDSCRAEGDSSAGLGTALRRGRRQIYAFLIRRARTNRLQSQFYWSRRTLQRLLLSGTQWDSAIMASCRDYLRPVDQDLSLRASLAAVRGTAVP